MSDTTKTRLRKIFGIALLLPSVLVGLLVAYWVVPILAAGEGDVVTATLTADEPLAAPVSANPVCIAHACVTRSHSSMCRPYDEGRGLHVEFDGERHPYRVYQHDRAPFDVVEGDAWTVGRSTEPDGVRRWFELSGAKPCGESDTCVVQEMVTLCDTPTSVRIDRRPWGVWVRPATGQSAMMALTTSAVILLVCLIVGNAGWKRAFG